MTLFLVYFLNKLYLISLFLGNFASNVYLFYTKTPAIINQDIQKKIDWTRLIFQPILQIINTHDAGSADSSDPSIITGLTELNIVAEALYKQYRQPGCCRSTTIEAIIFFKMYVQQYLYSKSSEAVSTSISAYSMPAYSMSTCSRSLGYSKECLKMMEKTVEKDLKIIKPLKESAEALIEDINRLLEEVTVYLYGDDGTKIPDALCMQAFRCKRISER